MPLLRLVQERLANSSRRISYSVAVGRFLILEDRGRYVQERDDEDG